MWWLIVSSSAAHASTLCSKYSRRDKTQELRDQDILKAAATVSNLDPNNSTGGIFQSRLTPTAVISPVEEKYTVQQLETGD